MGAQVSSFGVLSSKDSLQGTPEFLAEDDVACQESLSGRHVPVGDQDELGDQARQGQTGTPAGESPEPVVVVTSDTNTEIEHGDDKTVIATHSTTPWTHFGAWLWPWSSSASLSPAETAETEAEVSTGTDTTISTESSQSQTDNMATGGSFDEKEDREQVVGTSRSAASRQCTQQNDTYRTKRREQGMLSSSAEVARAYTATLEFLRNPDARKHWKNHIRERIVSPNTSPSAESGGWGTQSAEIDPVCGTTTTDVCSLRLHRAMLQSNNWEAFSPVAGRRQEMQTPAERVAEVVATQGLERARASVCDVDAHERLSALHIASIFGEVDVATYLLENDADPDAQDVYGWTPLMYAAMGTDSISTPRMVRLLLQHSGWRTCCAWDTGVNALDIACATGATSVVRLLLEHPNPWEHHTDAKGRFALHLCVFAPGMTGVECARALRSLLPNPNLMLLHEDYDGFSALHLACHENNAPMVQFLLDECGVSPWTLRCSRVTPMFTAVYAGAADVVDVLASQMTHFASSGATDRDSENDESQELKLELEAETGRRTVVASRAQLSQRNHCGKTPLQVAMQRGDHDCARRLLAARAAAAAAEEGP